MASATADRNLLFGILAVQMDFITRDSLIAAMNAWVVDKSRSLGQILVDQQALAPSRQALLDSLVQEHLRAHGDDPEKSLTAVGAAGPVREALQQVADAEIHASVAALTRADRTRGDPFATATPGAGVAATTGLRFRVLRPHARGGLGEVLVAEDEELHREVALKHIHEHQADQPESRARFLLEAEITGGLEHPGVVPVYGLGTYGDGRPYYAMRFIRGDSLKQAIDRFHKKAPGEALGNRTLELRQLLDRFVDVCNAIAYAHSRGVLHRDLKSANVMLGQFGETLVVDWGLAKARTQADIPSDLPPLTPHSSGTTDATLPGQMVGTPAYMAPEQAMCRQDLIDERTDIYGLGTILFEILTGKAPHLGIEVMEVIRKVTTEPTPHARAMQPSVPPALDAICAKAMAGNKGDRYVRAADLATDVQRFLADEPVSAWREPWRVRTRRRLGRHRTLVTATAATVLASVVLLAVAAVLLNEARNREHQARGLAEQNFQLAEHNYQMARQAVDRYFTEVSDNVLLHEPGMDTLRKQLLQAASDFYQKFAKERAEIPAARNDLGKAVYRLALITGEVESNTKAIDLDKQALDIFNALTAQQPDNLDHQSDLALCYYQLGRFSRLTDQLPQAEQAYQGALDRWGKLVQAAPDKNSYVVELGQSELGLGNLYQLTRRMDQALATYTKALKIRFALASKFPSEDKYQRDLATTRNDMGVVYQALGQMDKAQKAFQGAETVQEKLVKAHTEIQQYQDDLATSYCNLGDADYRLSQLQAAAAAYQHAVDLRKELVRTHPAILTFQLNLAVASLRLAQALVANQQAAQAEQACQDALTICQNVTHDHPDMTAAQYDLASASAMLGRIEAAQGKNPQAQAAYQQALAIQQQLARKFPTAVQYQSDLARTNNSLGLFYLKTGKEEDATAAFRRALGVWQTLSATHAQELEFVLGMSDSLNSLGNEALAEGQTKVALDFYNQSIEQLEEGSPPMGQRAGAQGTSRDAYWGRARTLTQLARYQEAIPNWNKVVSLSQGSQQLWFRLDRALALAQAGDHVQAASEAQALTKYVDSAKPRYQLAQVFAQCAADAAKDVGLPPDQEKKLAETYAQSALALLKGAKDAGYFQVAGNLTSLRTDPILDSLRTRPEFNAILGNTAK